MDDTIIDDLGDNPQKQRRRALLPFWIKFFTWLFLITGVIAPVGFVLGIFGINFNLALYGFETYQPLSLIGIVLLALYALKGAVAFGLWTEKIWAVRVAKIDGILGIVICIISMLLPLFLEVNNGMMFQLRFELIPLALYFIKMGKIENEWVNRREGQ